MGFWRAWPAARGPFLVLTPAVVALGASTAHGSVYAWAGSELLLVLVAALAAHISVNAFNEAADFRNGLDHLTTRTPFSGGSGLLPTHPERLPDVQRLAWGSLLLLLVVGAVLILQRGWPLAVLGGLGVGLVLAYSRFLVRSPWGSLLAPGLAFGPVMVLGTHVALGAPLDARAWCASMVPFFGVNNLLLLNQLPDMAADQQVGRRNWPLAYGTRAAVAAYGVMLLAMWGCLAVGWVMGWFPVHTLVVGLMLWPAARVWRRLRALRQGQSPDSTVLALNVWLAVGTPSLLALACGLGLG